MRSKVMFVLLGLLLIILSLGFVSATLSDANLKGHYTLNTDDGLDRVLDNSTYENELDEMGTTSFTTGKIDNAMVSSSNGCYYRPIAKSRVISYDELEHFSSTVWVYRTGATTSGYGAILSAIVNSGSNQRRIVKLSVDETTEHIFLNIADGSSYDFDTNITLALNTWTFIGFSYDGSRVNVYVDDAHPINASFSMGAGYSDASTGGWGIGCMFQNTYWGKYFNGRIDENSIWNRSLTASEMEFLYNDGDGYAYPFTPPPTIPYVNAYTSFDVEQTTASLGGTFFYEDYHDVYVYFQINGVNQTVEHWIKNVSASDYHTEDIIGLTPETTYNYTLCITYLDGAFCEEEKNFTTTAYEPPYINSINAFNITNHEAVLGATVMYGDYENLTLAYFFEGAQVSDDSFNQVDEFDTSEYYLEFLEELDYATTYDYRLDIDYIDPNGLGASDGNFQTNYRCSADTFQDEIARSDGDIADAGWTDLDSRRVTDKSECADLCNRYYGDPLLNDGKLDEGEGCCYWTNNDPYDDCYISDGDLVYNDPYTTNYESQIMNASVPIDRAITGTTYNFTTLDAYIPEIKTVSAVSVLGTTASIQGVYYPLDYNSTVPFFRLNGVDQFPKPEYISTTYGESKSLLWNFTGLDMNTTYNISFCVGYGLGWANIVCNDSQTFTTIIEPLVTFHTPNPIEQTSAILHWTIDFNGATDVTQNFNGNHSWINAHDGVIKDWTMSGLEPETNYTYFLSLNYTYDGNDYLINTSVQQFTTYYENAFDDIWDTALQGSSLAKILLGFFVLFAVVFAGVGAMGKFHIEISMIGILIFVVIGTILATLMKLFPVYILLLMIGGGVILVILKNMFFSEGGR